MSDQLISHGIEALRQRAIPEGGFVNGDKGNYRTDVTAWAILALVAQGGDKNLLNLCRSRLAASQLPDGRICVSADHPDAYWPTPLAILAWHQSPPHQEMLSRAAQFLLHTSGNHGPSKPGSPAAHDASLRGWPWIEATHSWIDPTALALIALKATGYGEHPRISEAKRMILDRQMLQGGWNYGNTLIFGAELRPMPENTGVALNALKDMTSRPSVERSLHYLHHVVKTLRTPVALTWSLLGLSAWGERPAAARRWLLECWQRQERYGRYDTTALALLVLASLATAGVESIFSLEGASRAG